MTIILDAVLAVLLAGVLGYAYLLNKRFTALQADRKALERLVASLADTSRRAETGIAGLRVAADQIGEALQQKIDRATALSDDLGYMLDSGGVLADRLENAVRAGRESRPSPAQAAKVTLPTRVERELRRVVEAARA